jgi:hypothetical protein
VDVMKLSNGQSVALLGGLVLFVNIHIPWFSEAGYTVDVSGSLMAWFGSLLGLLAAGLLLMKAGGKEGLSIGALKTEHLSLILAAGSLILILIKVIVGHEIGDGFQSIEIKRSAGVFLGLAASAVTGAGAFLAMTEQGLKFPGISGRGAGGAAAPPPPPPPPPAA